MSSMDGKVALVTGAGSEKGIGRATALAFAAAGATVVVADINDEGGHDTVGLIEAAGGAALFFHADMSKTSDIQEMVSTTVDRYGRLDYAHNNAGIEGAVSSTVDTSEETWDQTISVNLKGVWLCMKYEIPAMLASGGGAIVNTSSIAGLIGTPVCQRTPRQSSESSASQREPPRVRPGEHSSQLREPRRHKHADH